MKKITVVITLVGIMLCIGGCSSDTITGEKYNKLSDSIVMSNSFTYTEYEDALETFINNMYAPAGLSDMATSAYQMKSLTDELEFENLIKEFNFKEGEQRAITEFETSLGKKEYTENGVEKFMIYYTVESNGVPSKKAIEFYLNSSGLIYKHEMWSDFESSEVLGQ